MVIKINYTSSDVYVSTSVSPVYVVVNYSGTGGGGGGAVWGGITGTLSDQTDLQTALDGKFDDPTGTTSQYLRGDGSLATFPTIPSGTVTSVGLTMPSAFAVANSPITSSGTLAVTGAGTAAQYVRGDGALATFPTTASGGSSVNYYLNGSVASSVTGYKQMANTAVIGLGTDFNLVGNGLIAQFLTDAGNPNRIEIPGGAWNFEMYFSVSSSGGNQKFYVELLKYNGSTFTSIATGSTNPEEITGGTATDLYLTSLAVPTTSLLVTDRLVIRVYIVDNSVGRTITLHTEDNNLCEILTTFAGGIAALNGLTANTQYLATGTSGTDFNIASATDTHTFNLPTASATNRGALSSADWSTFNSKVGGSGVAGQVAYWDGTNSQTGSNNLFWDAANARLGIGTNAPISKLHIIGSSTFAGNATFTGVYPYFELKPSDWGTNYFYLQSGVSVNGATAGNYTTFFNYLGTSRGFSFVQGSNVSMVISPTTYNVLLGGTTDGGQRLQVYGDAFVRGSADTFGTSGLTIQNNSGSSLFRVLNNGMLRIGSTSSNPLIFPQTNSGTAETISGTNLSFYSYTGSQSASSGRFFFGGENMTQASGTNYNIFSVGKFFPTSGTATFADIYINPQLNQTGGANGITRGLYVNPTLTAAADWRSIEWSNNSGWGLYGAGTANNYLGGRLGIGNTNPTNILDILTNANSGQAINIKNLSSGTSATAGIIVQSDTGSGSFFATSSGFTPFGALTANTLGIYSSGSVNISTIVNSTGYYSIGTGPSVPTEKLRLTNAGRLLLGTTTESTFLLDVNGTARVSGAMTISGLITAPSGLFASGVLDIYSDGSNGAIAMRTLTNTLCLRKYVKVLGDDGGFGNNNASAAFQIDGTNRGFLPPRMTNAQRTAIATPAVGLMVYCTDAVEGLYVYKSTGWTFVI